MHYEITRENGRARSALIALLGIALAGTSVLWTWNSFAATFANLPEIDFRHAFGVALSVFALAALGAIAARAFGKSAR